jgi:hypothetical protein
VRRFIQFSQSAESVVFLFLITKEYGSIAILPYVSAAVQVMCLSTGRIKFNAEKFFFISPV